MAVYVSNIVINSGTTFSETFTLESATTNSRFDLSGYSGGAQMRKACWRIYWTRFYC